MEDAYRRWGERVAIPGGIDIDYMVRSAPEAIYNRARRMFELEPAGKFLEDGIPADARRPECAVVEEDGKGVPMRRGELEDAKGKAEDGKARTREVKVGTIFTFTPNPGEEGRRSVTRDRPATAYRERQPPSSASNYGGTWPWSRRGRCRSRDRRSGYPPAKANCPW